MAAKRGLLGLARRLSVHPKTLKTWMEDEGVAETAAVIVPVEIIGSAAATAAAAVTLVSPSGYRLEGLSLDDAIDALARLR